MSAGERCIMACRRAAAARAPLTLLLAAVFIASVSTRRTSYISHIHIHRAYIHRTPYTRLYSDGGMALGRAMLVTSDVLK